MKLLKEYLEKRLNYLNNADEWTLEDDAKNRGAKLEIERALKFIENQSGNINVTLKDIKIAVEKTIGIEDLSTKNRVKPYPDAVKLFVYAAKENTLFGDAEIMRYINRKRPSYSHNYKTAESLIATDRVFSSNYYEIINKLKNDVR